MPKLRFQKPFYRFVTYEDECLAIRWPFRLLRKVKRYPYASETRVIDMNESIAMLDPGETQFTTMLQMLSRGPDPLAFDAWVEDWGWSEISPEARAAYNYFAGTMAREDWERAQNRPVEWLEDDLFPRING